MEAASAFSLVMREFPGTAHWEDSAFKLAELRREMGDTAAAREAFVQIAENDAGALWGNAAHELVLMDLQRGNHKDALAWAERLTASPDPALRDGGERLKIELLTTLGRREEARQLCREVLASDRPEEMRRAAHHWLGRLAWHEGDWAAASKSFASAAQGGGGQAEDYLWWAKSLAMSGDTGRAANVAEEATARLADAATRRAVPLEMGRAYLDAGKTDEAVKEFLKVAILYPATGEARQALLLTAGTYERAGETQKAIRTLEELIEKHPQSTEAGEARQMLDRLQS